MDYDWPGNVRELENVIERAVVLSTGRADRRRPRFPITSRSSRRFQMPQFVVPPEGISFKEVITDFEKRLIESTLEAAGGVQKRAAELLHIKPTTLNEMIKRYDIRPRRKRGDARRPRRIRSARTSDDDSRRRPDEVGRDQSATSEPRPLSPSARCRASAEASRTSARTSPGSRPTGSSVARSRGRCGPSRRAAAWSAISSFRHSTNSSRSA